MKYQEVFILLPCHSLEDFPIHHEGDDAAGLLANWSAMWHPALLAATGSAPGWRRVDDPPGELSERLILIPSVSQSELPTGFVQRAKDEGAVVIRGKQDRAEIVSAALAQLDGGDGGVDAELAADFLALGYCYLQVELLTRQMRYSSNLDEPHFNKQVLAAAEAAISGDEGLAREKLTACFDVLGEERDHYYSVDAFVLDLTMVAPTTIGEALRDELNSDAPVNLLLSADVLEKIARDEPQSLAALKQALDEGRAAIIGGESIQCAFPLLSLETALAELRRGLAVYQQHLGAAPRVFGRRRFGLAPNLPQLLHKLGFEGALHATLDDGRFPEGSQFKTRWEGADGTVIDAIARAPLDAARPETYLGLAVKMGESMDMDHVATLCLAHWPGAASPWYADLRRIARYGAMLGRRLTVSEYFTTTDLPGNLDRFDADKYHSPYLKQAIIRKQADPISTVVRYWRRSSQLAAARSLLLMARLAGGKDMAAELQRIDELAEQTDLAAEEPEAGQLDQQAGDVLQQAAEQMAAALPRSTGAETTGCLVLNPHCFVRRTSVDASDLSAPPAVEKPVYAVDSDEGGRVIVDTPPMGFAWLTPGQSSSRSRRAAPPMAEENVVRNEFFEATINAETGALQSIHDYKTRGNRLSQQLALRMSPRDDASGGRPGGRSYSVMAADSMRATATATRGEVAAAGRLLDREGKLLADFEQTFRLDRGSRVLLIDIRLDPKIQPHADPWNSYFASRFAWANEAADMWRGTGGGRQPASAKRLEAPLYLEIEDGRTRTAILTGGLPYHFRCGLRMLDSLLIVRGERERSFRIGIGVDAPYPMQEALALLAPPVSMCMSAPPTAGPSSSWLINVDAKNVVATWWAPLENGEGFRVRLSETAGRPARAKLSCFRALASARQVDFRGQPLDECRVEDGKVRVEMAAHEWVEVEARFDASAE